MTKPAPRTGAPPLKLSPRTVLVLFAAVVLYLLLRPTLSGWLEMELPGLFPEDPAVVQAPAEKPAPGDPAVVQSRPTANDSRAIEDPTTEVRTTTPGATPSARSTSPDSPAPSKPAVVATPPQARPSDSTSIAKPSPSNAANTKSSRNKPAELAPTTSTASRTETPSKPQPAPNSSTRPPPTTPKSPSPTPPKLGQLTELGGKRFRSTAGLIYVQERSEHRIDHVLRHGEDDPSRPVHGVFSGDRETILTVIDEAWQLAQKGRPPKVEVEDQGDRSVFIIDLGRKIGYMGGQAGKRKRFPPCRHLQLVVEGNEVVTAYPTIPR